MISAQASGHSRNQVVSVVARKRAVGVVAAVVMLSIAGVVTLLNFYHPVQRTPPKMIKPTYFMDLKTGELFVASQQLPPILAPSAAKDAAGNGTGVLACVFSCGDCADEVSRFVAYLESTDPAQVEPARRAELTRMLNSPDAALIPMVGEAYRGTIVAATETKDQWLASETPEAQQIVFDAMSRCEGAGSKGSKIRRCRPPAQ